MPNSAVTGVTVPPLFTHVHSRVCGLAFSVTGPVRGAHRVRLRAYFLSYPNVPVKGVEPLTSWFVAKHSIRLSYTGIGTVDLCYSTHYRGPQTVGLR